MGLVRVLRVCKHRRAFITRPPHCQLSSPGKFPGPQIPCVNYFKTGFLYTHYLT